jgi:hypothetical protein
VQSAVPYLQPPTVSGVGERDTLCVESVPTIEVTGIGTDSVRVTGETQSVRVTVPDTGTGTADSPTGGEVCLSTSASRGTARDQRISARLMRLDVYVMLQRRSVSLM